MDLIAHLLSENRYFSGVSGKNRGMPSGELMVGTQKANVDPVMDGAVGNSTLRAKYEQALNIPQEPIRAGELAKLDRLLAERLILTTGGSVEYKTKAEAEKGLAGITADGTADLKVVEKGGKAYVEKATASQEQNEEHEKETQQTAADKRIASLVKASEFTRSNADSTNCEIEFTPENGEKEKYTIELIENGESPDLDKVQKLFEDIFGKEEVDPVDVLKNAVDGNTAFGTKDEVKYKIYVVKDSKGEVVSTLAGGLLDLQDNQGNSTGETVFMLAYAVTKKNLQRKGFAREAYISALIGARKEAEERNRKFSFTAGECVHTSEDFWNAVGLKRGYLADTQKQSGFKELKYIQPALDFDPKTGEVAKDAGTAPEHLMVDSLGGDQATKTQVGRMVKAFYRWNNTWPLEAFEGERKEEALQTHLSHTKGILDQFTQELDEGGQLTFMSKEERLALIERGTVIEEHTDADVEEDEEGRTGEEDL